MVALELGRVITTGTPDEVLSHPQVIESYLGTDAATIDRSGPPRRPEEAGVKKSVRSKNGAAKRSRIQPRVAMTLSTTTTARSLPIRIAGSRIRTTRSQGLARRAGRAVPAVAGRAAGPRRVARAPSRVCLPGTDQRAGGARRPRCFFIAARTGRATRRCSSCAKATEARTVLFDPIDGRSVGSDHARRRVGLTRRRAGGDRCVVGRRRGHGDIA